MVRAFLAVDLSDPSLAGSLSAIQAELVATGIRLKPVPLEQVHLTLKFFGEIGDQEIKTIVEALGVLHHPPIRAAITHLGAFPDPAHARVVWVGFDPEAEKSLYELEGKVGRLLANRVWFDAKPFKPHVTIARVKQAAPTRPLVDLIRRLGSREFGRTLISELKLKKSTLTPQGPIYADIHVFRLGERP